MEFVCESCGARASATTRRHVCDCGGLWTLSYDHEPFSLAGVDRDEWSIFRYRRFLPLLDDDSWRRVSMGEGMTPIVRLNRDVMLKLDYLMPTLSLKDRGSSVLMANIKTSGFTFVAEDSTGNAADSIAAYAGRAEVSCEVFVPRGVPSHQIDQIVSHGATCTVVDGDREQCARVCRARVRGDGLYYASHATNPFFVEGMKTYVYEVFERMGRIPANLVVPVGNASLFLGIVAGLDDLIAAGAISAHPKVWCVQGERCRPLGLAWELGLDGPATVDDPVRREGTLASSIAITNPPLGARALAAARRIGARFITAYESEVIPTRDELLFHGISCSSSSAASYAAYKHYCQEHGRLPDTLIIICSPGIKDNFINSRE